RGGWGGPRPPATFSGLAPAEREAELPRGREGGGAVAAHHPGGAAQDAAEGAVSLLGALGAGEDLVGDAALGEHPGEAGDVPLVGGDDEGAEVGVEVADRVGGDDGPVVGGVEGEA